MKNDAGQDQGSTCFGDPLAQLEARYFGLLEAAPDAMVVVDEGGQIVLFNLRAEIQFGYSRDELLGQPVTTIIPSGFAERLVADSLRTAAEALSQQIGTGIELTGRRKDGSEFPVELMLSPLMTTDNLLVTAAIRDISKRRISENKIIYLNRIYATLSSINTLIVRVQTRDELFREACRIAVGTGEFCKAWIGLVDDTGKKLEVAASAGVEPEMIEIFNSSFFLDEQASCAGSLVVRAVKENRVMFTNDAQNDQALLFGMDCSVVEINSTAVLPLVMADKVVGMVALYSREKDFFDDVELRLMKELARDISYSMDSIEKQEQLDYFAYYDLLTGLANRKLFLERVATHILRAKYDGHKLALYLFDLEGFKSINDSYGEVAGDSLLKQVAAWLLSQVGDVNLVARIEADHFAVVLPIITDAGDVARTLKSSMSELMEQRFHLGGTEIRVAAKVGIALFPEDAVNADQLFKMAEAALRRAKKEGDRYLFYAREMTEMVASRLSLENRLRGALEKEQFVLHYQPIVNFSNGAVCGAEALLRWNCPDNGLIQPNDFIPILEETGMIHEVGQWVLRQSIDDYLRWQNLGVPDLRVAVNLSQLQLRDPGFLADIEHLLDVHADAAAGLELEITEGLVMTDVEQSIKILTSIRELGCRISIDDFGTGYSSLSCLTRLPLDTLKIDRSFVTDMLLSSGGHVLVHAIIALAHLLEFNVLAEGVETAAQFEGLKLLNCNEMQGFLFSPPLPADVFEAKMVATNASIAQGLPIPE